jgi:hypothetical protein
MSYEVHGSAFGAEEYDPYESLEQFEQIALFKSKNELPGKPQMRNFHRWLHYAVNEYDIVREAVRDMYDNRKRMQANYGYNLFSRGIWYACGKLDPDFAQHRNKPQDWDDVPDIMEDPDVQADLAYILAAEQIPSNVDTRITPVKLVLMAAGLNKAVIADFGTSQGHTLALAAADTGYPTVEVGDRTYVRGEPEWQKDIKNTAAANDVLQNRHFELTHGVGFDIFKPTDPVRSLWSEISTMDLDERTPEALEAYRQRNDNMPDNVSICYGVNFTAPWTAESLHKLMRDRTPAAPRPVQADAALASYSTYEAVGDDPDNFKTVVTNADAITNERGIFLVVDAVDIKGNRIVYRDNRTPFAHRIYMRLKDRPERFQHLITADTSRMGRLILEEAFYDLPRAAELGFVRPADSR